MQNTKTKILRFGFYFVISIVLLISFKETINFQNANWETFSGFWELIKLYFFYLVGIVTWTIGYLFTVNLVDVFIKQPVEGTQKDNTFLINLIHSTFCGIAATGWFLTAFHSRIISFYITIFILSFILMLIFKNIFPSFSGKKLSLSKPYSVGDWIEIKELSSGNSLMGEVVDIKRKTIQIKTEGSKYISYSKTYINNYHLINYSKLDGVEFENKILISSDINPERAKRIINAALYQSIDSKGFLKEPQPRVLINRYLDHTIEYKIKYWIKPFKEITPEEANDILNNNLYVHFSKVGITLNYTKIIHYNVDIDKNEFEKKSIEHSKNILQSVDLFSSLTDTEITEINNELIERVYQPHTTVIKEGESGDSMFILVEGLLDVFISAEDKKQLKVAQLIPGSFFGEMSLLTGEQRSANIITVTESLVYEIKKITMEKIFQARPSLVEELGKIVAERKFKNIAMQDEYDKHASSFMKELISKIKSFFKI